MEYRSSEMMHRFIHRGKSGKAVLYEDVDGIYGWFSTACWLFGPDVHGFVDAGMKKQFTTAMWITIPVPMENTSVILASGSAARKMLLKRAGIPFETASHNVDEGAMTAQMLAEGTGPADVALALSRAKALDASKAHPGKLVIASDQVVACGGRLLGKPHTREKAVENLKFLRGKTHQLHSAAAVAKNDRILFEACEHTNMTMRDFSDSFLAHYFDTAGEGVLWCCGVYEMEGAGILLFSEISGREDVILGMPMLPLLAFLRREGVIET